MFKRFCFGLLGLICLVAAGFGVYGFAKLDGNPRYESDFIGVGGLCFIGAVVAMFLAFAAFRRLH
jgi:hypothetical protein